MKICREILRESSKRKTLVSFEESMPQGKRKGQFGAIVGQVPFSTKEAPHEGSGSSLPHLAGGRP